MRTSLILVAAALFLALAGCKDEAPSKGLEDSGADARAAETSSSAEDAGHDGGPTVPPGAIRVRVNGDKVVAKVDSRFLSLAVDSSQVVGGFFWGGPDSKTTGGVSENRVDPYDFARPRLRSLAAALAPAFLRIGGSEADKLFYDLEDTPTDELPEGFTWSLTRAQLDGVLDFLDAVGFDLMFTLNAGPGPRDAERRWTGDQTRALVAYLDGRGAKVPVYELGNEVNGFFVLHGPEHSISAEEYAADLETARVVLDEVAPGALLAGPASAFWPVVGEPNALLPEVCRLAGSALDVVTWHYYPAQSVRCPVATRRASAEVITDPEVLAETDKWAAGVEEQVAAHAPSAQIWLGETGSSYCGGQPGVSDRFAGSLWWLDELGRLARRGHKVLVRQTLSGSDYGLLDDDTLEPRPDYWASLLFKRLMGTEVLEVALEGEADGGGRVLAYAHRAPSAEAGGVSVLLLNLAPDEPATVAIAGLDGEHADVYLVTADGLDAPEVRLGATTLRLGDDGSLPALDPERRAVPAGAPLILELEPVSYAFVSRP